jgi:hypothetical protein
MQNLFLLPTDKPSRLRYNLSNVLVFTNESYRDYGKLDNQHIYITSDEEIKEDDWGLSKLNEIIVFGRSYNEKFYKKIILTTDQDLIADGVQAIHDTFLEWFMSNLSCEFVHVIKNPFHEPTIYRYKIIIPQEQPKPTPTENAPIKNGDVYDIGRTVNGVSRFLFLNEKWYYFEERLSRECRKDKSELTKLVNDTENDFNEVKYIGNIFTLNLSKNK